MQTESKKMRGAYKHGATYRAIVTRNGQQMFGGRYKSEHMASAAHDVLAVLACGCENEDAQRLIALIRRNIGPKI
jgi:hypothetical protein